MDEIDLTQRKVLDTQGSAIIDVFKEARQTDPTWAALYISCKMNDLGKNTAMIASDCTGTARQVAFMLYYMMRDDPAFAKGVMGAVNQYNFDKIKQN